MKVVLQNTSIMENPHHKTATRLSFLEKQSLCDQLSSEMDENPAANIPFTKEELIKRGMIDAQSFGQEDG